MTPKQTEQRRKRTDVELAGIVDGRVMLCGQRTHSVSDHPPESVGKSDRVEYQARVNRLRRSLSLSILLLALFAAPTEVSACRELFVVKGEEKMVGRLMMWGDDLESRIVLNPRGTKRDPSPVPGAVKLAGWKAKYGSVTVNCYGGGAADGINEHGLTASVLILRPTKYPQPDDRPVVAAYNWVPYFLDHCKTVGQAVELAKKVTVADGSGHRPFPLHLMLCDATGDSAVLEYLDARLVVHHPMPVPFLANAPYAKTKKSRRAATLLDFELPTKANEAVTTVFDRMAGLLDGQEGRVKWTVVHDVSRRVFHFRTRVNPRIAYVDLKKLDFSTGQPRRKLDMYDKTLLGDATKRLAESNEIEEPLR